MLVSQQLSQYLGEPSLFGRHKWVLAMHPTTVEFRHRSWAEPAVFPFLKELGLGYVCVDEPSYASDAAYRQDYSLAGIRQIPRT